MVTGRANAAVVARRAVGLSGVGRARRSPLRCKTRRRRSSSGRERRQIVDAGAKASPGHAAFVPVHVSATSQIPAVARHVVVAGAKLSAGARRCSSRCTFSATSQIPADARHVVVGGAKPSVGHVAFEPVHVSADIANPADGATRRRRRCEAGRGTRRVRARARLRHVANPGGAGDTSSSAVRSRPSDTPLFVPVHVSATSQIPADGRHVVVGGAKLSSDTSVRARARLCDVANTGGRDGTSSAAARNLSYRARRARAACTSPPGRKHRGRAARRRRRRKAVAGKPLTFRCTSPPHRRSQRTAGTSSSRQRNCRPGTPPTSRCTSPPRHRSQRRRGTSSSPARSRRPGTPRTSRCTSPARRKPGCCAAGGRRGGEGVGRAASWSCRCRSRRRRRCPRQRGRRSCSPRRAGADLARQVAGPAAAVARGVTADAAHAEARCTLRVGRARRRERRVVDARGVDGRRPRQPARNQDRAARSSVDVWPCTAAGSALVAVQVVVPFQTSPDGSDAVPLEPPDTSTVPARAPSP